MRFAFVVANALIVVTSPTKGVNPPRPLTEPLQIATYVSDSVGTDVVSTLIYGPTEGILVDTQGLKTDAERVADLVAERHIKLKAIFITHGHDDHFMGIDVLRRRFPGTPVYMAPAGLKETNRWSPRILRSLRRSSPAQAPDTVESPEAAPARLSVDGEDVQVFPDRQGDAFIPSNSYLWIPSIRAIIAGDIVFAGVHPYLSGSTEKSRTRWLKSLDELSAQHPTVVVAGHKASAATPDAPAAIDTMRRYITTLDSLKDKAESSDDLAARMRAIFPDLRLPNFLARSAHAAFPD
jgi:glyoxylase-like metal-dependent hydrolase (beta-lactamase superfamily II)